MNCFTYRDLAEDLAALGVQKGDTLYVHTSLKALGALEQGAQTLFAALTEAVGESGTFAVPTHTYQCRPDDPFDPAKTPSALGVFPNYVWRHSGAYRTGHASHSSAAYGANAAALCENNSLSNPFSDDSVLARVCDGGGKVLLLGVGQESNSMIHLAEHRS